MTKRRKAVLQVTLEAESSTPLYKQIYDQIRNAIISGALSEGDRLTSIRNLAHELGVSHTTIEQAYLQLATEGFVSNIPRSGYRVCRIDAEFMALDRNVDASAIAQARNARNHDAFFAENESGGRVRYNFSYANLQPDSFPANTWRKLMNEVLYQTHCPEMARYGNTNETNAINRVLAKNAACTRDVHCLPEQVIIQAGTDSALTTILQLFDRDTDVIGMEEPGYATMHETARRLGFRMVPLPSDQGTEAFLAALRKHRPSIVFTTPSHQFPTGKLLSLNARTRLLKWAEENNSYIIEDDSCNEFRYSTRPIPSLQSLDAYGRVIYLCNVSKVLSPALRIAYMVLPPTLLSRYWDVFNYAHQTVSWLEQEVLARFIEAGHWDAHVRKTARGNHRRHDELIDCLERQFGGMIDIAGKDTGMHLYLTVHNGMSQAELLSSAYAVGVQVYGTSRMWFSQPAPENKIIMGFSAIADEDIAPGVAALASAWLQAEGERK